MSLLGRALTVHGVNQAIFVRSSNILVVLDLLFSIPQLPLLL